MGVQEAIDPAEMQAQGGVAVSRQVQLPPGPYCNFAAGKGQLPLLWQLFTLEPPPVQTAALRRPAVGVGSHRCGPRPGLSLHRSGPAQLLRAVLCCGL